MDNLILKKRLSTFKTDKGVLKNVSDDVLHEVLIAWEQWPGTAKDFYTSIGVNSKRMAKLIGKAKKLKREGFFPEEEFKELKVEAELPAYPVGHCSGAEVVWSDGKIIRFNDINLLVDFLKKAA